jgi:tetratricopeptide (TPR) repeat protein
MVKGWEWFLSLAALAPSSPPLHDAGSHDSCATGVCMLSWVHGSAQAFSPLRRGRYALIGVLAAVLVTGGCSIRRYTVNTIGDVLASGDSLYESDDDIVLIGDALPFSLKLIEGLLAESPNNRGLLLSAARGFVLYSYAYVHYEAEQLARDDVHRARALHDRARRLYLRAFRYALRALAQAYPGFAEQLSAQPQVAVQRIGMDAAEQDVPLLYWTAAALGLAISLSKNEPTMLARLPEVDALLERALTRHEDWNAGALHEFKITWTAARGAPGGREEIRRHYERALTLSQGRRASAHIAYAEAGRHPQPGSYRVHNVDAQGIGY